MKLPLKINFHYGQQIYRCLFRTLHYEKTDLRTTHWMKHFGTVMEHTDAVVDE